MLKNTKDWLINDIHIFRNHYLKCNLLERKRFKKGLFRYKGRFDTEKEFFSWYLKIVS